LGEESKAVEPEPSLKAQAPSKEAGVPVEKARPEPVSWTVKRIEAVPEERLGAEARFIQPEVAEVATKGPERVGLLRSSAKLQTAAQLVEAQPGEPTRHQ
jgi:hypothetical protein